MNALHVKIAILEFKIRTTRVVFVKIIILTTVPQHAENVILAVDHAQEQPKMTAIPVLV